MTPFRESNLLQVTKPSPPPKNSNAICKQYICPMLNLFSILVCPQDMTIRDQNMETVISVVG